MSDFKQHWDKKHQPSFINQNRDEAAKEFKLALEKAKKNPSNGQRFEATKTIGYMERDGIPHKMVNGNWIPLTRIN